MRSLSLGDCRVGDELVRDKGKIVGGVLMCRT